MSPMPAAPPGTQGMRPPTPKDTRAPWLRLMDYRVSIADWDPARMARCEEACFLLEKAPVRLRAHAPLKDEKAKAEEEQAKKAGPPPVPMSETQRRRALVEARGPSRLRYEVRAQATSAVHRYERRRADAPSTTASGAGQPKGGLYGARRSPATASHRAKQTPSHPPRMHRARADDAAHRALDIDEEPSPMARPTVRALATRLFTARHPVHAHVVPAAPKISAPMPLNCGHTGLKRKRGRADEAAAPPTKRRAKNSTQYARSSPGSHSAESGTPVGRHVQNTNITLPPPGSRASFRAPEGTKTSKALPRWAVTAWTATVHALAAVVTAKLPATKN